ncbi:MAG: CBS domain-containing protein [Gaiellaceae bacterium]
MKVADVMTADVITVQSETSLKEVAAILAERRISGVPVVDEDGKVVGVVSEADILFKERGPSERKRMLAAFTDPTYGTGERKLEARNAAEAMTAPAHTIASWRSVSSAAAQMLDESVNRLPVVDNSCLVGIVTRADLVRAFVRPDIEIKREIREEVLERGLLLETPGAVAVAVDEGKVTLGGTMRMRTDAELAAALVAKVPGVVEVDSSIDWREDNRKHRSTPLVIGTRRGT